MIWCASCVKISSRRNFLNVHLKVIQFIPALKSAHDTIINLSFCVRNSDFHLRFIRKIMFNDGCDAQVWYERTKFSTMRRNSRTRRKRDEIGHALRYRYSKILSNFTGYIYTYTVYRRKQKYRNEEGYSLRQEVACDMHEYEVKFQRNYIRSTQICTGGRYG